MTGTVAITCMRDEGACLTEWLAHHRAVGIDHFVVFTNDCSDTTEAMLDHCATQGWLTHVPNPGPYHAQGIQFTALNKAAGLDVVRAADWICAFDVDEFINVRTGDGTLAALRDALPEADAITLTWRLFGNADQVMYEDRPVTESFTRAAPEVMFWPWRHALFKTLYRNSGHYGKPGVHRPRDPGMTPGPAPAWYDGQGRLLPERFAERGIFSPFGRPNYGLVQLNHYAIQSMAAFVLKSARGRVNRDDGALGLDYWVERNFNQVEDRSILDFVAGVEMRAKMMADPVLAALHAESVAWRLARFDALMAEEPSRALMGRLMQTPPSRVLSATRAQFLLSYASSVGEDD